MQTLASLLYSSISLNHWCYTTRARTKQRFSFRWSQCGELFIYSKHVTNFEVDGRLRHIQFWTHVHMCIYLWSDSWRSRQFHHKPTRVLGIGTNTTTYLEQLPIFTSLFSSALISHSSEWLIFSAKLAKRAQLYGELKIGVCLSTQIMYHKKAWKCRIEQTTERAGAKADWRLILLLACPWF
jgi:hypothetical protein